jgi:tetratricopeptide (TPR) repeat protein
MPLRAGHGDPQFERQDATKIAEQALGRILSPGEVSDYWFRRSWEYIRSESLHWLRLMARKWWMLWNIREFEDTDDFYLYQRWSGLLTVLGTVSHFGLLVPLATVGMMLTWKQRHRLWLLYALLATLSFSIVLFYVFGRYRFSLVPLLVLFPGAAIAEGLELYKERNVRQGIRGAVAGLLVAAGVNWPIFGWPAPSAAGYYNVGNALVKQGRLDQAIESYQQALKILPTYALAYYSLGNTFAQLGQLDKAIFHYQEAIKMDPDLAEAHNNLGNALARQGQLGEAIGHFQEALKIRPDSAQLHYNLGRVLAGQGNLHQAVDHFRQALRIQPSFAPARESLGQALAEQGNRDKAAMHDQEALQILKSQSGAGAAR